MKKIIKLKESDLQRIVKKVIVSEQRNIIVKDGLTIDDIIENGDNSEIMYIGSRGEGVKEIQEILSNLNYDLGDYGTNHDGIDSKFGHRTRSAVEEFQEDNDIKDDGIVGIETANSFREVGEEIDDEEIDDEEIVDEPEGSTGCIKGDCENGQGTYIYDTGSKYVGEWKDGLPNGQGTINWLDGDKYVGEWKDGKKNGQGTYKYSFSHSNLSGSEYVGGFKDNKRNGQGTRTYANGNKYVGEYKDDKYNGQGTFTWVSGSKYIGEFKDGLKNGQGTYNWSDGDKYVGEWKDNKRNGQGTYTNADGSIYHSGLWREDVVVEDEEIEDEVVNGDIRYPSESSSASPPLVNRWGKPHHGYDINADRKIFRKNGNVPLVVCNNPGTVTHAGKCGGYGNLVEIKHGNNDYSSYGHLYSVDVSEGETVNVGDVIGVEGSTGKSSGNHVHFEFRVIRPNGLHNRCGEGSPDVEVNGFSNIRPLSDVDKYYYYQVGDNSYS